MDEIKKPDSLPFVTENQVEQPANAQEKSSSSSGALNQQEFLTLLVNQLQQQDPLNPMESQDFAVQLAQFTQVEQLIGINEKLDGEQAAAGGQISSMAAFLGHEVVLGEGEVSMTAGRGPGVLVDLPAEAQSARMDFVNSDGQVVGSKEFTAAELSGGTQKLSTAGANVPDGTYSTRIVAVDSTGRFVESEGRVTGTVEGFIMEPEPRLLVDGQEVALDEVKEVYKGV